MTYALREARDLATHALPAPIARAVALMALTALGLSSEPFHETFHAEGCFPALLLTLRNAWESQGRASISDHAAVAESFPWEIRGA
jgi:hypothetical protein